MAKAAGASTEELRKLAIQHANEDVALAKSNATIAANTFNRERNTLATLKAAGASDEVIEAQQKITNASYKEFQEQDKILVASYKNRKEVIQKNEVEVLQEKTNATKKANDDANSKATTLKREDYLKDAEELERLKNKLEQNRLDKEAENKAKADAIQQGLRENAETPAQKLKREYDEQRAILVAAHQNTLLLDAKFITDKKALEAQDTANKKENALAQEEIEKQKQKDREQWLSAGSQTLKQAANLLGESTSAGKALAIAATTIDTYQSATAAYKSLAGIPVVGPALGGIAAGVAVASGLANVKKILAVKVPGAGGGGGSAPSLSAGISGGGGASSAPKFNVVGNSGVNQLAGVIAGKENTPVKAFVVAQDVTTGQGLNRNIIESATLG